MCSNHSRATWEEVLLFLLLHSKYRATPLGFSMNTWSSGQAMLFCSEERGEWENKRKDQVLVCKLTFLMPGDFSLPFCRCHSHIL